MKSFATIYSKQTIKDFIRKALKINLRNLIIVFLVSFLFRLIVGLPNLINTENALTKDSYSYLSLAADIKLLSFHSFFRTPGYPLFIAFTTTELMPNNIVFTLLIQILLDSMVSLILIGICYRLFDLDSAAILAGLFYALSVVSATLCSMIMGESLNIFYTLLAIYILVLNDSIKAIIGQALFWGLATLTRPSSLFFPIISYFLINTKKIKYSWKKQTVAIILYAVIILGWCSFNYARTGRIFFSTVQSAALYKYEESAVQMLDETSILEYAKLWLIDPRKGEAIRGKYETDFFRQVYNRELSEDEQWNTIENPEVANKLQAEAETRLKGKYLSVIIVHLVGAFQIFRPISPSASTGILGTIFDAFRLLLFSLSLIILLWKRILPFWMFISISFWLIYTFFLPGVNGIWRFRAIGEPVICIIISLGVLSLLGTPVFAENKNNDLNKVKP